MAEHLLDEEAVKTVRGATARHSSLRLGVLLCLVMIVLGTGCGQGDDSGDTASETTTSTLPGADTSPEPAPSGQDPGASGSGGPLRGGGGGATGAPLKMPAIAAGGQLNAQLLGQIGAEVARACNTKTPCVTLRPVDQKGRSLTAPRDDCDFTRRTDPPAGREVRRGSVVKLIFTCDDVGTPSDTTQSPTTQPPTTEPGGQP